MKFIIVAKHSQICPREIFQDMEAGKIFFKNSLPNKIIKILDWEHLELTQTTFNGENFLLNSDSLPIFANRIGRLKIIQGAHSRLNRIIISNYLTRSKLNQKSLRFCEQS